MPIKLIPPREGKTPHWYGRGTHLGRFVDRSTKTVRAPLARQVIKQWERQIERGEFSSKGEATFLSAAVAYGNDNGDRRPVQKLIAHFGEAPLRTIDQDAIDAAALKLFPTQTAATRNREVYTPVSAILKHAGINTPLRRPKGARGREVTTWLWPEQAQRLFVAAKEIDVEFAIFLVTLCYTGMRLSEGLSLTTELLRLSEATAHLPTTKNGKPRAVFLPDAVVAALENHPRGTTRPGERLFRFRKSGRLYSLLTATKEAAGKDLEWVTFHTYRHTWATWMRRYGGLDTKGLVATGAWDSEQAAGRYAHAVVSEEARKASLLPTLSWNPKVRAV